MKTELGLLAGLCLLLAPGIRTDQLNIENSFLEARLNSLNRTHEAGSLDLPLVDLLFHFIAPSGPGVSRECNATSVAYKDALENVSWMIVLVIIYKNNDGKFLDSHLYRFWPRFEMVHQNVRCEC